MKHRITTRRLSNGGQTSGEVAIDNIKSGLFQLNKNSKTYLQLKDLREKGYLVGDDNPGEKTIFSVANNKTDRQYQGLDNKLYDLLCSINK